jgi:hypothetical protein
MPFIEFGLGLSGFTETTIAGTRHLGGDFEFTELLRTGLRFGDPNDGITYGVNALLPSAVVTFIPTATTSKRSGTTTARPGNWLDGQPTAWPLC